MRINIYISNNPKKVADISLMEYQCFLFFRTAKNSGNIFSAY